MDDWVWDAPSRLEVWTQVILAVWVVNFAIKGKKQKQKSANKQTSMFDCPYLNVT